MTDQGPGQVLFDFVRHWSRRTPTGDLASAEQGRLVVVCEAVRGLVERGRPATVNAVAHELGIDQSGASRLIGAAASAGYVVLAASTSDGRRREASLSDAGAAMLADAHRWQEQVFARLTAQWTERRRAEFRRAMTDLLDASHEVGERG